MLSIIIIVDRDIKYIRIGENMEIIKDNKNNKIEIGFYSSFEREDFLRWFNNYTKKIIMEKVRI